MRYEVNDGRILTWSLEAHVVDQCNLRCAECCTLSPRLADRATDPARFEADLARARTVLAPSVLKLTGGEPLLHPEIVRLAEIARASRIAPAVSVTTNGLRLLAAPEAFWRAIDRITVSWYSSAPLPESTIAEIRRRADAHGVVVTWKHVEAFQRMDAPVPNDPARASEIHGGCWLRNRCHLLHEGRFYTCTRPPHLDDVLGAHGALAAADGVSLAAENLGEKLRAYLERETPLASCTHCLGASGELLAHRQLPMAPA